MLEPRRKLGHFALAVACIVALLGPASSVAAPPANPFTPEELGFFDKEVLPLLKTHCHKCHGETKARGSLRLISREAVLQGGDLGPAVSLDKPDASNLLKAINYRDGLEMPPSGKLPPKEIEILTRWVKAGVPFSSTAAVVKAPAKHKGGVVTPESRTYWAYQPVRRPEQPAVQNTAWVRSPIDAFVLAKLESKGLTPAADADPVALVRRACYDLTGLPPTPQEVDEFVRDPSPAAYERLLDRLLKSPHYGEKWGRHWLDLVRYAETNGYERDGPKPHAWRFRDYVIRSFNDDKPFDRFIREQLAGDELPNRDTDAIIATGYYRLGLWDDEPADPLQARFDELDDYVATTSQVFLGMTMNCARCHEHKIDPIPHADYYRLLAFFADVPRYSNSRDVRSSFNLTDISPPERRAVYEKELKQREARLAELTASMTKIEEAAIKKMPAEDQRASEGLDRPRVLARKLKQFLTPEQDSEYSRLKREADELKKKPEPARDLALSVNNCTVNPKDTHVLVRGSPHSPGARVAPGFPQVLGAADPVIPPAAADARSSGRRTVLANWISSPDNPLTARVLGNRLWQYHFGRGIVTSANDFGQFGTLPTHPELLDWLAREIIDGGWKLKRMHKLLMLSHSYQMSSQASSVALKADPENALLSRFSMRRLNAEEVRDSFLAVSGRLNLKMGGPSVYPTIPREVLAGQSRPGEGWGKSTPEEAARRSVYVYVKRSLLVPILSQHDQADTDSSCPVRYTTTVPTQSLGMLNGEFSNEQAAAFAERLQQESPNDVAAQVHRAIRLSTGRSPATAEIARDMHFIEALQSTNKLSREAALRHYCLLALNANEFIYLD